MEEINKVNKTYIGATIARTCQSYGSKFSKCTFICKDKDLMNKYFPNKKILTEDDIEKVYSGLYNKFVLATEELNNLSKRDVVHRSEIEGFLKNIRDTYYEYDDFAIIEFEADYPRCHHCKEIILKPSVTLNNTCSKCDHKVYAFIIEKCGIESIQDILIDSNIRLDCNVSEMVEKVLKNNATCSSLIERYNKLLKEGALR